MKRKYSKTDIFERRMNYLHFILSRREKMYDFKQQALQQYVQCQRQRGDIKRAKLSKLSQDLDNKLFIPRIAVSVTNQCSLKCRDCNNLMPYCKERFFEDVKDQIMDLKKLLRCVDGIISVEVIGGEPFVYKYLPDLLQYLCDEPRVKYVEITSNGTILPSKDIIPLLCNPKICVFLSDYGKINSEKAGKTYQYFLDHHVRVHNLQNRKWILPGGVNNRKKTK